MNLPYDKSCPVIYDNDWSNDYVDWLLMALASAGDINYCGVITSSSVAPYNQYMTDESLTKSVNLRAETIRRGINSGFKNLPQAYVGTRGNLVKPESGNIDDTKPLDSPGTRRIIEIAKTATPDKPLVMCMGGPLTVVADAILIEPSIVPNIVVSWLESSAEGMNGFNGWSDGWAAYIVLERLRLIQFSTTTDPFAVVTKEQLKELPDCEAREYMLNIKTDVVAPEGDADGPPVISIMRPDYINELKPVSFGKWVISGEHEVVLYKDDPNGTAFVATSVNKDIATEEWWRAMKNPLAWHK